MTQVALSRVGDVTRSQQADLKKNCPPPAAAKAQLTAILGEQQDSSQSLLLLVLISTDLTSLLLSVQNVEINPTPPQGIQAHPRGSVPW